LVDNDKALGAIGTANLLLQLNNFAQLLVNKSALTLDQLFSLFGARVVEARVDLGLLVFQTDVEGKDESVFDTLGHIGVSSAVVEGETTNELCVGGGAIWQGQHRRYQGELELVKELEGLGLCKVVTVGDDSGVEAFGDVALSLLEKLADEDDSRGSTVTSDVVLCSGSAGNHDGGRVLDLHLAQQDTAILGKLDAASAIDQHLEGTRRTQVGGKNTLPHRGAVHILSVIVWRAHNNYLAGRTLDSALGLRSWAADMVAIRVQELAVINHCLLIARSIQLSRLAEVPSALRHRKLECLAFSLSNFGSSFFLPQ
ncbi:hypothetical protein KCV07_g393, partial [Aureobasidium melanogenum]